MFFVGVDLGQRRDHTAIVAVQRTGSAMIGSNAAREVQVRFAERMPLGTPYPHVVERVRTIVRSVTSAATPYAAWPHATGPMTKKCTVIVDATGVGAPVVDLMRAAGLGCEVVAVAITGGDRERNTGRVWSVPKRDLIGGVQMLLERGELRIAAKLREREKLRRELLDMETHESSSLNHPRGRMRFGAEGAGEHDDLVIALALGCWRARMKQIGEMAVGRLF